MDVSFSDIVIGRIDNEFLYVHYLWEYDGIFNPGYMIIKEEIFINCNLYDYSKLCEVLARYEFEKLDAYE